MAIWGGVFFSKSLVLNVHILVYLQTNETIMCGNGHGATMKRCRRYSGRFD